MRPSSVASVWPGTCAETVPSGATVTDCAPSGTWISGCSARPSEVTILPSAESLKLPARV
jgi:hypothetical protein